MKIFFPVYVYSGCAFYCASPFVPLFLETFFPLKNGSYPVMVIAWREYFFFDQFDYFYYCSIFELTCVFFCLTLFAATDTIYLCTVQHVCGLFEIVW